MIGSGLRFKTKKKPMNILSDVLCLGCGTPLLPMDYNNLGPYLHKHTAMMVCVDEKNHIRIDDRGFTMWARQK